MLSSDGHQVFVSKGWSITFHGSDDINVLNSFNNGWIYAFLQMEFFQMWLFLELRWGSLME